MLNQDRPVTVRRFAFLVLAFLSAILPAPPTRAGDPTKKMERQPGGEGAVAVDAAKFDSVQAAIDSLPVGGGVVNLPPGRIEIDKPIVLSRGDVMIRGCGTGTHIVNRNQTGEPALRIEPPAGDMKDATLWRVQIADLRITGNPKSGAGLYAKSVDEILISRVAVEHNGGDGIVLDHCYENPRVSDSLINYNARTGLNLLACHDIVVSANQFEENEDALHCIDGYNLTMTGNNLDDHLRDGVVIENTYGSVVASNMIEECDRNAIVLTGECYGDTISANVIADHKGEGVRLVHVRDITVSANTFVLEGQAAVRVTEGARQITITGNTFNRYPFDSSKIHRTLPACGIEMESTRDVTISGNTFTGLQKWAVAARGEGNRRLTITGNTILNPSQASPGEFAGMLLENLTDSILANNIVTDDQAKRTMKRGIEFSGQCGSNIVVGNRILGDPQGRLDVPGEGNQVGLNIVSPKVAGTPPASQPK
jgi:hypothetical protein